MERTDVLELMATLKLYGMRAAYDEVMTTGIKRRHDPPRIVSDLLSAEIAEKQARSIKYQLTIAKLPLAKDIDDFDFTGTPVNEAQIRDLASGAFLAEQRNAVLIGGTGTGKSHLAIAIARACIRSGARGRFYTVVDLVNRLESEARASRQGRLAEYLTRMDVIVLDELGYLPFAQTGGQLLFHLVSRLYERTSVIITSTSLQSWQKTGSRKAAVKRVIVMANDGGEKNSAGAATIERSREASGRSRARPLIGKLAQQPAAIAPRCVDLFFGRYGQ
jgi:DNA replication protein DnaC